MKIHVTDWKLSKQGKFDLENRTETLFLPLWAKALAWTQLLWKKGRKKKDVLNCSQELIEISLIGTIGAFRKIAEVLGPKVWGSSTHLSSGRSVKALGLAHYLWKIPWLWGLLSTGYCAPSFENTNGSHESRVPTWLPLSSHSSTPRGHIRSDKDLSFLYSLNGSAANCSNTPRFFLGE